MPITHQAAHTRTSKGWDTKHRHPFAYAAVAVGGYYAQRQLRDIYSNRRNRASYTRENGEKILLTGFNHHERRDMQHTLRHIDRTIKPDQSLHNVHIQKRHLPIGIQAVNLGTGIGYARPGLDNAMKEYAYHYKQNSGRDIPKYELKAARKKAKLLGFEEHPKISVDPKQTRKGHHKAIITHELGHIVDTDYKHSGSAEFKEAARWKRDADPRGTGLTGGLGAKKKQQKGYKGGAYQGVSPSEDFAESFRLHMGYKLKALDRGKHGSVYDKRRYNYMKKNVMR